MNTSMASASFIVERLGASGGIDWRTMPMMVAACCAGRWCRINAEFLSGKKMCRRGSCLFVFGMLSCNLSCSRSAVFQQRLKAAGEGGQQFSLVGVRRFQPECAETAGNLGDGGEYRCQAVALRKCWKSVMQTDQLARKNQFAIRQ